MAPKGRGKPKKKASRSAARGRKPGQTSKAIKVSAAANGELGGRPKEVLPEDLLARIGLPPDDELEKTAWWARLLEVLQWGVLQGRDWVTLMRDARANALTASKLVPETIKAKAAELLDNEDREIGEDAAPDVTPIEGGSHARSDAGALRRNSA